MRGRLAEVIRTFREQRRFGDGFDILTASFVFVFTVLKFFGGKLMKESTQRKNKLASRYLKKLSKQMVKVSWIFGFSMKLPASQAAQIVRATSKSDRRSVFVEKTSLSL